MNDDSVLVWAKLKNELPELVTFSICTWVKFTYEVRLLFKSKFGLIGQSIVHEFLLHFITILSRF